MKRNDPKLIQSSPYGRPVRTRTIRYRHGLTALKAASGISTRFHGFCFFFLAFIVGLGSIVTDGLQPVWAADVLHPLPRKILAIYDANEGINANTSKIFENCQSVLNHLGMIVDYRDVNRPLPEQGEMVNYQGILTWFESDGVETPQAYLTWLAEQADHGMRLVVLGSIGFSEETLVPAFRKKARAIYTHLGLAHENDFTKQRPRLRYTSRDRSMVDFERPYPPVPMEYDRFVPLNDSVRVHLAMLRTDRTDRPESAVVTTSPGGGMVWGPHVLWREGGPPYRRQWYINPFAFFETAFDLATRPRPDATTLNGRRIAFSHIDGDAFAGISQVKTNALCAEIIRERILEHYSFPVTVSVIVGEIDPAAQGNDRRVDLARRIFALPNVEPASHAYSHPFYWDPDFDNSQAQYPSQYGMKIPGYEFDAPMEIDYSVRYITEELAPPGKPCRVFLWTGNCRPLAEHIKRCDRLNLFNMNGGDTVFDAFKDSYSGVAPLYRDVDGYYQFHIGQANENILTNLWEGPFYGYREIITTMVRTGTPRRIKPIDVYYHFYSGQYEASLNALISVYDWVVSQPIAPMFTSAYLQIARSWIDCRLQKNAAGDHFVISDYGQCLTLRFDTDDRVPDMARSRNVLGYVQEPQGLFVHLAPGETEAHIVLAAAGTNKQPYLQQASGWVRHFQTSPERIQFDFDGFGKGQVVLAGLAPHSRWHVHQQTAVGQGQVETDETGRLTLSNVMNGPVEIGRR